MQVPPITSASNVTSSVWNLGRESGELPVLEFLFGRSALTSLGESLVVRLSVEKGAETHHPPLWLEKYMPEKEKRGQLFLLALVSVSTGRFLTLWSFPLSVRRHSVRRGPRPSSLGSSLATPNSCKHSAQQTRGQDWMLVQCMTEP